MKKKQAQVIIPGSSHSAPLITDSDVNSSLKSLKRRDPLRVVFFGTPEFVLPVFDSLHKNFQLVGVVTTPDAPVGRKQIMTASAIGQKAEELHIEVMKHQKLDDKTVEELLALNADLFVVASYGKIIPQSVLDVPTYGSINIHPSKLPFFRGATPIQSQILEGINDSSISLILVDAKMDHGPLIHQEEFIISDTDTNVTLHDSMFKKAAEVLPGIIEKFVDGDITPLEQKHDDATFCKVFTRESGYFELDNPPSPQELDRMIRAFYPWPTAWTKWNGKILKFLPDKLVQPEGKKPMKWKEFLNGYRDFTSTDLLDL